jgi:hypothetical protein
MSNIPKYPPDGLSATELQEWAAVWSADTRRMTEQYIKDGPFMQLEDWLSGARFLHWKQERSSVAYRNARLPPLYQ